MRAVALYYWAAQLMAHWRELCRLTRIVVSLWKSPVGERHDDYDDDDDDDYDEAQDQAWNLSRKPRSWFV